MLVIRLSRMGRKDRAIYRLVVSEKTKDTYGDYLEQLGFYNPGVNPKEIKLEEERIRHWISKGAQTSPTVHNLLVDAGIIEGKKVRASKNAKPEVKEDTPENKPAEVKKEEAPKDEATEEVENIEEEKTEEKPAEEASE